jgi:hypothetical protein
LTSFTFSFYFFSAGFYSERAFAFVSGTGLITVAAIGAATDTTGFYYCTTF